MDELTIKIPTAETAKPVKPVTTNRTSKHCGTFTFITLQAILITGMIKIALDSPITDAELFLPLGSLFAIYAVCVLNAAFNPRYASK
jgi:hypothetical protein